MAAQLESPALIERAHVGDLAAMTMRSRLREGDVLARLDGDRALCRKDRLPQGRPLARGCQAQGRSISRRRSTMRARVRCEVMPIPVRAASCRPVPRNPAPSADRSPFAKWVFSVLAHKVVKSLAHESLQARSLLKRQQMQSAAHLRTEVAAHRLLPDPGWRLCRRRRRV